MEVSLLSRNVPSSYSVLANNKGIPYPLSLVLTYDRISSINQTFTTSISTFQEPTSYAQAIQDPKGRHAMDQELCALHDNCTWSFQPLPPHKKPISCKWVYKIKFNLDGTVDRYQRL